MDKYGYPTTRKHPRTLAEAFPDERACAIERPAPTFDPVPLACVAAFVAFCILAIAGCL